MKSKKKGTFYITSEKNPARGERSIATKKFVRGKKVQINNLNRDQSIGNAEEDPFRRKEKGREGLGAHLLPRKLISLHEKVKGKKKKKFRQYGKEPRDTEETHFWESVFGSIPLNLP